MKKIIATALSLLMSFSLFACSKDTQTSGNNENNNSNTEMVWTAKTGTYTFSDGTTSVVYSGELKEDEFIMSYYSEMYRGKPDRQSMIFEYESDIITKIRTESQDFEKEVVPEEEIELSYDDATSTLTRTTTENGEVYSTDVYKITWDAEGRISQYELNVKYYQSDDNSEYNYKYTYSYGTDNFTITCDENTTVSVDDERIDAIRRNVTTIPYDEKGDITTVTTYVKPDGTIIHTGWGDKKTVEEKIISNWWGYVTSHTVHYSDGTVEPQGGKEYTFDTEGRIIKMTRERYKNNGLVPEGETPETITDKVEFEYDTNGNLTKISRDYDGVVESLTYEWMQIPAKLDSQITMLFGCPHWSVAEYIDNYIDFNYEGRLTVRTYTKEAFLSYIQ